MENKIIAFLIAIVLLGTRLISESIENIRLRKIMKEQTELINRQFKIIQKQQLLIDLIEQEKKETEENRK